MKYARLSWPSVRYGEQHTNAEIPNPYGAHMPITLDALSLSIYNEF